MTQSMRVVAGLMFGLWWISSGLVILASHAEVGQNQAAVATNSASSDLPTVFKMPALAEAYTLFTLQASQQVKQGDLAGAESTCRQVVRLMPFLPDAHYNLACAQALAGQTNAALDTLGTAIERGYRDAGHIREDPDLVSLRPDPRFRRLLDKARITEPPRLQQRLEPALITNEVAWVRESNTAWDGRNNILRTFYRFADTNVSDRAIIRNHGEAGDLLRQWFAEGTATGNLGDFYDNRDQDHSNLSYAQFPQLTRIEYSPEAIAHHLHYGLQIHLFHSGIVIGNSSTAQVGTPYWRSQARLAYLNPRVVQILYAQYTNNHLYLYPEHQDHDPGHNGEGGGYGDVIPANTPYLIISQGSSGSDQAFLDAVACTLAAFRPEVKEYLAKNGALMPTVQMILRSCSQLVTNETDYLTGVAHPTVFDSSQLHIPRMVKLAHEITRDEAPPLVHLRVVEEDTPRLGRDYFDVGEREKLFDTPAAIARIWRSTQSQRRMVVSAEDSQDLNSRRLSWRWTVLRGDPDKVRIRPLNRRGSVVELTLTWQPRQPVVPGSKLESNRIDIGAFVHNGKYWSAPGFVTFYTLDNEQREYDLKGRLLAVTYTGADEKGNYVDPMLDLPKSWRDEYHYDSRGRLTGWTRQRGEAKEEFSPSGELIVRRNDRGEPVETRPVRYVPRRPAADKPPVLEQQLVEPPASS